MWHRVEGDVGLAFDAIWVEIRNLIKLSTSEKVEVASLEGSLNVSILSFINSKKTDIEKTGELITITLEYILLTYYSSVIDFNSIS